MRCGRNNDPALTSGSWTRRSMAAVAMLMRKGAEILEFAVSRGGGEKVRSRDTVVGPWLRRWSFSEV